MTDRKKVIGWREWVALPELGIPALKAKIDTGARTSALHAFDLETVNRNGRVLAVFGIHPLRKRRNLIIRCEAEVIDERVVSDSGGHREKRLVIRSQVRLGDAVWPVELTLTNRDSMLFPMLIGRTAMHGRFLVDPQGSYTLGRKLGRVYQSGEYHGGTNS